MLVALLGVCVVAVRVVDAFDFLVNNASITQCGAVQFNWTAGSPPYQITAIGVYDVPVNVTVPDTAVTATGGTYEWAQFPFNRSSQVVFVMSDANGFATGGVSPLYSVDAAAEGTPDCKRTDGSVPWTFSVNPRAPETITALPQCKPVEFSWNGDYKSPVNIVGVIPGGMVLMPGPNSGTEMSYPVNVQLWSSIVYVSWDAAGVSGGTTLVMQVTEGNTNCLGTDTARPFSPVNLDAPSTRTGAPIVTPHTSGTPGRTSSGTAAARTSSATASPASKGSGTHFSPGAIAGIVVGVIVGVLILQAILIWFCCRRQIASALENRKQKRAQRLTQNGVDLYETPPGSAPGPPAHHSTAHNTPTASLMAQNPHAARAYDPDDLGISPFLAPTTPRGSMGRRSSNQEWAHAQGRGYDSPHLYDSHSPHMGYDSPRMSVTSGSSSVPYSGGLPAGAAAPGTYAPSSFHGAAPPLTPTGAAPSSPTSSAPPPPGLMAAKLQLAFGDQASKQLSDGMPSPRSRHTRYHQDAGPLLPPGAAPQADPQDKPPSYDPHWDGK